MSSGLLSSYLPIAPFTIDIDYQRRIQVRSASFSLQHSRSHKPQNLCLATNLVQTISNNMSGRKRKAEDDLPDRDRMSFSPSPAPTRSPPQRSGVSLTSWSRNFKRPRTNVAGKPLALPRLLETLSADEMRSILRSICDRHPAVGEEIGSTAPRPSPQSAIIVLRNYMTALRDSFPYGNKPTSEYTFNRIRPSLFALLEALNDFTPSFLPPNETQMATSLVYLDAATSIIHELPDWHSFQHDRYKSDAYEDIAKSWACVIREAAKKGGGIQLQVGGWDAKLNSHNSASGGKLGEALAEMSKSTGWFTDATGSLQSGADDQKQNLRDQILSGTYGANAPIQVGPW